jgi:hypothetical protein
LTEFSDQPFAKSPIVIYRKINGFKQVSQFVMVALEFEGFPRSHFPPFWLQRQDLFLSKTPSSRRLTPNQTRTSLCTCHVGRLQLVVHHLIDRCQENNLSGIGQVSFPTKQQLNPICQRNTEKPLFSLRLHHTVEIGFSLCLSRPVVFVWRTMQYALQSL